MLKKKSNIGKQCENPSSTQPSHGGNSNRFCLIAHLSVDKEVGNDINDLCGQAECSLRWYHQLTQQGAVQAPSYRQRIEKIVDIKKVKARASMGGVLRLYAADANTFPSIVNWL